MLKEIILKIYRKLTVKRIKSVDKGPPDVDEWIKFLNELPEARTADEKSYNKYLCRTFYLDGFYLAMMQIAAFFTLFYNWLLLLIKRKKKRFITDSHAVLVVDDSVSYEDILPKDLYLRFGVITEVRRTDIKPKLNDKTKSFFWSIYKKRPWNFYYNYLILREISFYCALYESYRPEAIIVYVNERNIASAIIKAMLGNEGVEWISFMHGDYLLQLIQGYMSFSTYYVWDNHYIPMFKDILNADCDSYKEYIPDKLKNNYRNGVKEYDLVYYLGIENRGRLERIANSLSKLEEMGWKYRVRPHPRSSNLELIRQIFPNNKIEDFTRTTAESSLCLTRFAASLNSTMLMQAYYGGVRVVIDDYSDPERYETLKKRRYIMLEKEHILLSDLIEGKINV